MVIMRKLYAAIKPVVVVPMPKGSRIVQVYCTNPGEMGIRVFCDPERPMQDKTLYLYKDEQEIPTGVPNMIMYGFVDDGDTWVVLAE